MCILMSILMEGGGFAAARPSIVRKKVVALLLEFEATCPLKNRIVTLCLKLNYLVENWNLNNIDAWTGYE